MNREKKLTIFISFIVILIIASLASADTNNTNDIIKFSIKSKFLGQDKNFNTEIFRINITVDRLGKLTYIENYYLEGGSSLKFQSSAKYFDAMLTDNNVSFNISRQKPGRISDRNYVFIESIILFDNKIIFNKTVNLSDRYRLSYTNIVPIKSVKPMIINNTNKTKNDINNTKDITKNTGNITNTGSKINKSIPNNNTNVSSKRSPGFVGIVGIIAIFIIYLYRNNTVKRQIKR